MLIARAAPMLLAVASGCRPSPFSCVTDVECGSGVCTPAGYCGSHSDACESGYAYGAHAGEGLAGLCVPVPDPGGADSGPGTGAATQQTEGGSTSTSGGGVDDTRGSGDNVTTESTSSLEESTGEPACAPWWDAAWPWRRALTVDAGWEGEVLADFPVPVPLSAIDRRGGDGSDLRFVASGCTVRPHEIELGEGGQAAIAWVSFPEITPDAAPVYLYYGNPDAAGLEDPDALWDDDFVGVWHMSAPDDSSGAGHVLQSESAPAYAPGQLGSAGLFNGIDDRWYASPSDALAELPAMGLTVSAWIWLGGIGGTSPRIVDKGDAVESTLGFVFSVRATATGIGLEYSRGLSLAEFTEQTVDDVVTIGQWYYVAVAHSGDPSAASLYVDGEPVPGVTIDIGAGEPLSDAAMALSVSGAPYAGDRFYDGLLDELRISSSVRSSDFIAAEARAGRGDLIVIGPAEGL